MGARTWWPARCSTSNCDPCSLKALSGPQLPSALPSPTLSCVLCVRLAVWCLGLSADAVPP
eukprot:12558027-Alexandrium_andersonii.AAC.1